MHTYRRVRMLLNVGVQKTMFINAHKYIYIFKYRAEFQKYCLNRGKNQKKGLIAIPFVKMYRIRHKTNRANP